MRAIPCAYVGTDGKIIADGRGNAIIRFASPSGVDTSTGEQLRLLAYASYFAHISDDWCSPSRNPVYPGTPTGPNDPGDDVFEYGMRSFGNPNLPDRLNGGVYRAGYNVGPKFRDCVTKSGPINDNDAGPCGTFVSSVFPAIHYYNPNAYSDLTKNYFTQDYTADISNVY